MFDFRLPHYTKHFKVINNDTQSIVWVNAPVSVIRYMYCTTKLEP